MSAWSGKHTTYMKCPSNITVIGPIYGTSNIFKNILLSALNLSTLYFSFMCDMLIAFWWFEKEKESYEDCDGGGRIVGLVVDGSGSMPSVGVMIRSDNSLNRQCYREVPNDVDLRPNALRMVSGRMYTSIGPPPSLTPLLMPHERTQRDSYGPGQGCKQRNNQQK